MNEENRHARHMFALFRQAGVLERLKRLMVISEILGQSVASTTDLSAIEMRGVVDVLEHWKRLGELEQRCHTITNVAGDGQTSSETQGPVAVPGSPLRDRLGHQLVEVQFEPEGTKLTYAWNGDGDLQVGDKVQTPPAWWIPPDELEYGQPCIATVTGLGSNYPGSVLVLTERAE